MLTSFPPIIDNNSEILILGTMPSVASLQKKQYYGFKQNKFWKFMGEFYGANIELNYKKRTNILLSNRIAIWDVLKHCERSGSLDSEIKSEQANDFNSFLNSYQKIRTIIFNGQNAKKFFYKHVKLKLPLKEKLNFHTAPSTSPANASTPAETQKKIWFELLETSKKACRGE